MLAECIGQLAPRDRDLIRRRYEPGATVKTVAAEVGRPVQGLYKAFQRIEDALHECVSRKTRLEEQR
jgi:RNA polymerase sigma-70 factor (ECF subfamily)